ncbi:MAG: ribulose-phosphate 3-epimerase [Candidatus Omnitrophica bacterium]|nr:ribulose-phosphate 3-epimerase [Candidatus Omnitrophota bacterium]MCM8799543.1 ribulose-phosphate 3-epimerase [Candidatus Omnitrophota bacterium]
MIKVAASILSADFSRLAEEIKRAEKAGVDLIHIDVMDGNFVPNITIGPQVVKDIRKTTELPFDVHLMIKEPLRYIDDFISAGSDMLTVHIETVSKNDIKELKNKLFKKNIKLGISLNPATPLDRITPILKDVDFVLVMTVNPGFGGQKFISWVVPKIKKLRKIYKGIISVDGGINEKNAKSLASIGVDIFACGSYIFNSKDPVKAIKNLKELFRKEF